MLHSASTILLIYHPGQCRECTKILAQADANDSLHESLGKGSKAVQLHNELDVKPGFGVVKSKKSFLYQFSAKITQILKNEQNEQRLGEPNVALNHLHLSQKQTLPRLETPQILSTIIVFVLFIENKLIGLDLKHYMLVPHNFF